MTHDEKSKAYKAFFKESVAGQEFVEEMERLITAAHESAEDSPEHSRDHAQRAKGVRTVLEHITGVMTEIKKGRA